MLVSICIPTYNAPGLFKRCLNSVLEQEYKDYEIIVSDDSSTDDIKTYVDQLKIPGLFYFKNSVPLGSPLNWNNAMQQAKGTFIKILHHDDYFTTKKSLGKFVAVMEKNPEAMFAFSYTNIYFKKQDKHFLHKQTLTQLKRLRENPGFLFFRNIIGAPSVTFFRKDLSIVFNKDYKWLVDVEFYIRYLKKHKHFLSIAEPLVTIVDGEAEQITQNVSGDKKLVITENLQLFSEIYTEKLDTKKVMVFFQELFVYFDYVSFDQLAEEFTIPDNIRGFLISVFNDLSKNKFLKALKRRLLTSRYNKRIFKIERF